MSIEYLCMLGLRGAMGSFPGGGRWPQKSGKARMLNPGIDLVLVAAARYSWGSCWGIQAPCLSSNLSIIIQWWDSSAPSTSSSCSSPLWTGGVSSLGAENNNDIRLPRNQSKQRKRRETTPGDFFKKSQCTNSCNCCKQPWTYIQYSFFLYFPIFLYLCDCLLCEIFQIYS